jgi:hypothetical protein
VTSTSHQERRCWRPIGTVVVDLAKGEMLRSAEHHVAKNSLFRY